MKPLQALKQTITRGCRSGLNVPLAALHIAQVQLLSNLTHAHGIGEVLLVGIYQQHGIAKLILIQHPLQLIPGVVNAVAVVRVNDKNDGYI